MPRCCGRSRGSFLRSTNKNSIYDLGKNEKRKRMNASIKTQQRPRNKDGRCTRAQSNRNNKEKRSALLNLERQRPWSNGKVAKQSFHENCLSNVVSSHVKRGSSELANAQQRKYAHNCQTSLQVTDINLKAKNKNKNLNTNDRLYYALERQR